MPARLPQPQGARHAHPPCTPLHPLRNRAQPSLVLKILRGAYDPAVGLSPDLTAIIHRCLSQAPARRPSVASLLAMPAVRAKAAELGIELPPLQALGAAGGSTATAALTAARAAGGPGVRPPPRRATCPEGGCEGDSAMRRVTATGERPRKPALPAAATPSRRQTEQEATPPSRRRTVQVGAEAAAGRTPRLHSAALADSLGAPQGVSLSHAAAAPPERRRSRGGGGEPSPERRRTHNGQPSPERRRSQGGEPSPERRRQTESHFSVKRWLRPGARAVVGAPAVADATAAVQVQRSAKSDGQLPAVAAAGQPAKSQLGHPSTIAEEDEECEAAAAEAAVQQAAQLRARLVALLCGDAALLDRWHGLARAAMEAENGGTAGGAGAAAAATAAGRPTMAALTDELFGRLDMSCAAEALHLLLRVLALEEQAA